MSLFVKKSDADKAIKIKLKEAKEKLKEYTRLYKLYKSPQYLHLIDGVKIEIEYLEMVNKH